MFKGEDGMAAKLAWTAPKGGQAFQLVTFRPGAVEVVKALFSSILPPWFSDVHRNHSFCSSSCVPWSDPAHRQNSTTKTSVSNKARCT